MATSYNPPYYTKLLLRVWYFFTPSVPSPFSDPAPASPPTEKDLLITAPETLSSVDQPPSYLSYGDPSTNNSEKHPLPTSTPNSNTNSPQNQNNDSLLSPKARQAIILALAMALITASICVFLVDVLRSDTMAWWRAQHRHRGTHGGTYVHAWGRDQYGVERQGFMFVDVEGRGGGWVAQ